MPEGYLAIAFDDNRYLDIAANLALSIQRADTRPISILINSKVKFNPDYTPLFDQVIEINDDSSLRGAMNKARLFDHTPYDKTMYVDADCLLFNSRIEFFWRKYNGHPFAVEGHKQKEGSVFSCSLGEKDAAELCRLLKLPYITVFNAGVMYFERTPVAKAVFERVLEYYEGPHRDAIGYRYKHPGEYADEPFFGTALASLNIPPFQPPATDRLQVTTPNILEATLDIDLGYVAVVKPPAGKYQHIWSGVLCHFCGLAPIETYFAIANKLRKERALPPMDRKQFQPVILNDAGHRENILTPEP
ncbi:MAG: hypothetical protein CMG46_11760 [Candidatus Marinimicrobia bacterium]|nr:hypothetical protein [Candidatus Neomarinimicrobiota bacterium]